MKRGFTLVELMISLSLLGLFLTMVMTSSSQFLNHAPDTTAPIRSRMSTNIGNTLVNLLRNTKPGVETYFYVTPDVPPGKSWSDLGFQNPINDLTIGGAKPLTLDAIVDADSYVFFNESTTNTISPSQLDPYFSEEKFVTSDPTMNPGILVWMVQRDAARRYSLPAILLIRQATVSANLKSKDNVYVSLLLPPNQGRDVFQTTGDHKYAVVLTTVGSNFDEASALQSTAQIWDTFHKNVDCQLVSSDPVIYTYSVSYRPSAINTYKKSMTPSRFSLLFSVVPLYTNINNAPAKTRVLKLTLPTPYDLDAETVSALGVLTGGPIINQQSLYVQYSNTLILY